MRSRSGRALGAVAGVFLLPCATLLLGWNEVRASDEERALAKGASAVQEASADRVDPALEGELVHVAGPLRVPEVLADPDFPGVRGPPGAVRLRRSVQTYQWQERTGRGAVSYAMVWSEQAIDSTHFRQPGGPQNPPPRYQARSLAVPEAWLGPYRLSERMLDGLPSGQAVVPAAEVGRGARDLRPYGGGLYAGANPDAPAVGDQRITWETVRAEAVSVVALQRGAGFAPYRTRSGSEVNLIAPGLLSAEEMIDRAEEANAAATWALRALGTGLLFLSILLLLRSPAASVNGPSLLGRIVGAGPAQGAALLTVIGAPAIIAVTWLAMRPVVGASALAIGAVTTWWAVRRRKAWPP